MINHNAINDFYFNSVSTTTSNYHLLHHLQEKFQFLRCWNSPFPLNFSKLDEVNSIEEKKKIKERKYPPLNSRGLVVNHERAAGGPGAALVAGEIFYRRCGVSCRLNRNLYANPRNLGFSVRPPHKHRDYAIKTGSPFRPVARETFPWPEERMDRERASRHEPRGEGDKVVGEGKFTEDVGTRYKSRP